MRDASWNLHRYKRDLAIVGGGILAAAACFGAAVAFIFDHAYWVPKRAGVK